MLTEVDLGVNIDLIDPDTYALDPNGTCKLFFHIQNIVLFEFLLSFTYQQMIESPSLRVVQ